MKAVFLGPPGAGKGTLAGLAKTKFGIPHISTGDIFRENIKNKTELGKKVKGIMDAGGLVGDDIVIALVKDRLSQDDCKKGFILDGFPRTIPQAEALDKIVTLDCAVNINITNEEVIERLSGRRVCPSTGRIYHVKFNPPKVEGKDDETGEDLIIRDDDKIDVIKNRLDQYDKQTKPLIEYYKNKGLIFDVFSTKDATENVEILAKKFK